MPKPSPVVEILRPIAANTALLQIKTHQYHQNTKGINFTAFHELVLDVQYKALVKAVDRVGERIKKLFGDVPVTREYFDLGDIDDAVIGASEIEIIKDKSGRLYIVEINPRFPAWVYLAVASGQNMPEAAVKLAFVTS
jgi:hypothetical protein